MTRALGALHRFDRVASTMDVLHAMALDGAEAGTAVVAAEQSGGRGSRGRIWTSPRGGLWLSVLLRPSSASGLDLLSLRAGMAVARSLSAMAEGEAIRVKWPNDLMLADKKVGGILCEARWQGEALAWVVVGLGINVVNAVPDDLRQVAANLEERLPGVSPEALIEPMAAALREAETDSARLSDPELERFEVVDWLYRRTLVSPAAGVAAGIAGDGALLIRQADGRQIAARAGPVELDDSSVRA